MKLVKNTILALTLMTATAKADLPATQATFNRVSGWTYVGSKDRASCGTEARTWLENRLAQNKTVSYNTNQKKIWWNQSGKKLDTFVQESVQVVGGDLSKEYVTGHERVQTIMFGVHQFPNGDVNVLFIRSVYLDGRSICSDGYHASVDLSSV